MTPLRIVIAGGGIGGLTAAIALRKAGHDPIVLERAPALRPVGAGLTVQPNALLALREIGLDQAVVEAGTPWRFARLKTWRGWGIATQDMSSLAPEPDLLPVAIRRTTLHEVLLKALGKDRVWLGAEVKTWTADRGVTVSLGNGQVVKGDLLVGADGIKSAVRAVLHGDDPPRYAGYTCWRGLAPRKDLWPADETTELWGRGRRFGIVPVDGDKLYWFAVLNAAEGGTDPEGGLREAAAKVVARCMPPAAEIVASTAEGNIVRNDIVDRPPNEEWGTGPVTLLGDAAHAMTPNMGQGACQAIEDAVVLGHKLSKGDPEKALRSYERNRRERTRWFVEQSWSFGVMAQRESWWVRTARDFALRLTPSSVVRRGMRRAWDFRI